MSENTVSRKSEPTFPAGPGRVSLVASLTEMPGEEPGQFTSYLSEVSCLEVRADLVGDLDPEWLRERLGREGFDGLLLYTLRSCEEGGQFEGGTQERRRRLEGAATGFDLVDLEAERDGTEALQAAVPPEKRILSWHGDASRRTHVADLAERALEMIETPARLYKLVPSASTPVEALATLQLLAELRRDDVVAFATGEAGVFSRLLAPRFGARVAFGSLGSVPAAPGQLTIERLCGDFGFPLLHRCERLFGIVGHPVAHSLSPRLHNGAYRALGVPAFYLPFDTVEFGDFWFDVVESDLFSGEFQIDGLSVTTPHKRAAPVVAAVTSPLALRCESSNTLVNRGGVWEAHTTDADGVLAPLVRAGIDVAGRRSAVVGSGGAGRAAAAGLKLAGADLVIVNRTEGRGRTLAADLEAEFVALVDFDPGAFDVLVNATPLGSEPDDEPPWDPSRQRANVAVVEMNYAAGPTRLVEQTRLAGGTAITGREVLVHQALRQFEMMTHVELPYETAAELIGVASPIFAAGEPR